MIALDTTALIWALQGKSIGEGKTLARVEAIQALGGPLILPAPALAEFLVKTPKPERPLRIAELQEFLIIAPFDYHASRHAADLLRPEDKKARTGTWQAFKVDVMIFAVASARRASHFIHADGDFDIIAKAAPGVELVNIDSLRVQSNLPLGAE